MLDTLVVYVPQPKERKRETVANTNLHSAKRAKNDEFYTRLQDIEAELKHYRQFNAADPYQNFNHFQNKVVFCNCDDPDWSNFWRYFTMNFDFLGIKKLISTHYEMDGSPSYAMILDRDSATGAMNNYGVNADEMPLGRRVELTGNGDFRSPECIAFLKESDIVVTNPPFSLFREYVAQIMAYEKQFILMANQNAITYKEIFPLIKNNRMWLGTVSNKTLMFSVPEHYYSKNEQRDNYGRKIVPVPAISWFTNLDHKKRHENLPLFRYYEDEADMFPSYDNYDAINVDRVKDIPCDYEGVMGVPITFLDKYNPEQFEIMNANDYKTNEAVPDKAHGLIKDKDGAINGKPKYARILIRNLHPTPKPASMGDTAGGPPKTGHE